MLLGLVLSTLPFCVVRLPAGATVCTDWPRYGVQVGDRFFPFWLVRHAAEMNRDGFSMLQPADFVGLTFTGTTYLVYGDYRLKMCQGVPTAADLQSGQSTAQLPKE